MFLLLLTSDAIKSHCDIFSCNSLWKVQFFRNFIKTNPWTASWLIPAWIGLLSSFLLMELTIISEEKNQICNFLGSEDEVSIFQEPKIISIIYTIWINID